MITVKAIVETKDRHGDPVSSVTRTVMALAFAPDTSSVTEDERGQTATRRGTLYFRPGALDGLPAGILYEFTPPGGSEGRWGADGVPEGWTTGWSGSRVGDVVRVKFVKGV